MSDDEEKKCECPEGLPPWLATFADLMSLLMCFFVLLLSFSEMDAMKFKRLAGSMAQAFGVQNKLNVIDVPKGTSIIAQEFSPGIPKPTPISEIFQSTDDITKSTLDFKDSEQFDVEQGEDNLDQGIKSRIRQKIEELNKKTEGEALSLATALSDQISNGQMEIETQGNKIIVRIREKGSFKSGSAELAENYIDVMEEVREVLLGMKGSIQVHGHTDDIPIKTARFRSNWELSSSRAVSVAAELMKGGVIEASRFQVSGFADTRPLVKGTSSDARIRNRRVEIVIKQGLDDGTKDDIKQLQEEGGGDILRDLDLNPDYLFDLSGDEIF